MPDLRSAAEATTINRKKRNVFHQAIMEDRICDLDRLNSQRLYTKLNLRTFTSSKRDPFANSSCSNKVNDTK